VIGALQRTDPRIHFFDLPKAPHRGELNRDYVMRQAKGRIICHHNDDDLWLPRHIELLERALDDADFVGAMQVNVDTDGKVRGYYFDLERQEFVEPWLEWIPNNFGSWACNGFSPIFVGHRLDAFLRLPEGWTTTPAGLPADQVMWHKFLRQPWCRVKFLRWPIALQFPSPDRADWTPHQRAEELRHWTEIVESPDYAARIWRDLLPDLGDRLLHQSLNGSERCLTAEVEQERTMRTVAEAKLEHERTLRAVAEGELEQERTLRALAESELEHERILRAVAEGERDAMRSSTSWQMTASLRRTIDLIRHLRA
jgi:hypothetical protein